MKSGKAPGHDEVHAEILKTLEEEDLDAVTSLFNKIYTTGVIPEDWLKSTFVPIPKKSSAKRCEEFRTISLMSHVLKLFLKIIHGRIYRKCEEQISDTQLGFRGGLGTRDALFAIQVLVQRCLDMNKDVFLCFIDYEKAFDRVQHEKMIQILQQVGLDSRDVRIIANLYWNQKAHVRFSDNTSEDVEIRRGVRQGCVLSPLLFNLYSDLMLRRCRGSESFRYEDMEIGHDLMTSSSWDPPTLNFSGLSLCCNICRSRDVDQLGKMEAGDVRYPPRHLCIKRR
ncbi:UNVERIFIED_CONTAM: hypothetical protein PYX00_000829 [Menopon gallinae]|uniref:Reverse transcriptase domain-containing protein n=1 Tax=Menopon gallinae TaxID=328185 RepID=A0AAW2IAK2_9NEOP